MPLVVDRDAVRGQKAQPGVQRVEPHLRAEAHAELPAALGGSRVVEPNVHSQGDVRARVLVKCITFL